MKIFLVGGAVRDELLNRPIRERDWVVVGATAEQMLNERYSQVGKDFPVFLHPETKDEYALARTERKSGRGYTGFVVQASPEVTLEQDLMRRDLTINAIAKDEQGNLIDPFDGQRDLKRKVLRHVSPAFVEDPLRVLRVARFAARFASLGFTVAPETMELMREITRTDELRDLVPERVWLELTKALSEDIPSKFFTVLRECEALAVLFPELDRLFGVPQRKEYHPEVDTGIHVMMVVDQAAKLSKDISVRFAALTHDLGKGETPKSEWPSHHGHEARSVKLVRQLCSRYRVPNPIRDIASAVAKLHGKALNAMELRAGTLLELFEEIDAFRRPERVEQFVLSCQADFQGRPGYEELAYPQGDFLRSAFRVIQNIDAKPYLEKGLQGEQIGMAIRRSRAQMIARFKQEQGLNEPPPEE